MGNIPVRINILILSGILAVIAVICLVFYGLDGNDALLGIGSACVGGIATALGKLSGSS